MPRRPAPVRVRLNAPGVWDHMARNNFTYNGLAEALRITRSYVSHLINGQRFPPPSLRRRLLQVLPTAGFDDLFIVEHRCANGAYMEVKRNGGGDNPRPGASVDNTVEWRGGHEETGS